MPVSPSRFTDELINELFTYHPPDSDDLRHYEAIRAGARAFARIVVDHTPPCADQTHGMRQLREAVATFNASVALKGQC